MKNLIRVCIFAFGLVAASADAGDLPSTLHKAAKDVVAHCKSNDIGSLGTLKFIAVKGGKPTDNIGTLNSLLAKRLEVALVLSNDPREPLTLVDDASAKAATLDAANYMIKEGRSKLFTVDYDAMWGSEKIRPDAFVTGMVEVDDDLTNMKIVLFLVIKEGNRFEQVGGDYVAAISPSILTESGESFSTRGAFDGGKVVKTNDVTPSDLPDDFDLDAKTKTILASAKKVRDDQGGSHPLADSLAAVKLQVLYDGQPIPFEVRDGSAFLREPKQGQRVEIVLQKDSTPTRYGVVVKVNGQNTLMKHERPDAKCGKWILSKPNERVAIRGFQMNTNELEQFRVLSKAESKEREFDYGSDVGTMSISVFAEGKPPALLLDDDARETEIIETAKLPEEPSSSFGALKAKLLADANRGLIAEGNRVSGAVRTVKFHADESPVMAATATYYKP